MALTSIGDMALHFATLRQGVNTRSRLAGLTQEMASLRVGDAVRHLQGRTDRLADLDRQIAIRGAEAAATRKLGDRLVMAQNSLDLVETLRGSRSADLIGTPVSASPLVITNMAARAEATIQSIVVGLNVRFGGENLFGGTATDRASLAEPEAIMASLRATLVGATTPEELATRVETFFLDPAGGFATMAYLGDNGAPALRRIEGAVQIELGPRADDPALRETLRALALAAVVDHPGLSQKQRVDLLHKAGEALIEVADPLAAARARLGAAQEDVEAAETRLSAAQSAATILRTGLIEADPGDTATRLEQVRVQLETQYTVTARLSGMSLVGFLR